MPPGTTTGQHEHDRGEHRPIVYRRRPPTLPPRDISCGFCAAVMSLRRHGTAALPAREAACPIGYMHSAAAHPRETTNWFQGPKQTSSLAGQRGLTGGGLGCSSLRLLPVTSAIVAIDLADPSRPRVVTDRAPRVLARRKLSWPPLGAQGAVGPGPREVAALGFPSGRWRASRPLTLAGGWISSPPRAGCPGLRQPARLRRRSAAGHCPVASSAGSTTHSRHPGSARPRRTDQARQWIPGSGGARSRERLQRGQVVS
jgi:hypothetical protein